MAQPTNRTSLGEYCFRQLGAPVLEINVDEEQLEDCLDDAIAYWQEYHSDVSYKTYVSHQITDSDVTNEYISIPTDILTVNSMFQIGMHGFGFADLKYEMFVNIGVSNGFGTMGLADMAYYEQLQQQIALIDMQLSGTPLVSYVRHEDRLYLHGELGDDKDIKADDYVMYEAWKLVDPSSFPQVFSDVWLKEYTTALVKRQWGQNLSKFEGIQLLGGVILNGFQILEKAEADIERLREKIRLDHEWPTDFMVG